MIREEDCFETERLRARPWTEADIPAIQTLYASPEVVQYIGLKPIVDIQGARAFFEHVVTKGQRYAPGLGAWALEDAHHRVLGAALLKNLPKASKELTPDIEIGWHLGRPYWGHGYATEVARALLQRAFTLHNIDKIHAVVEPLNTRSVAVARRAGLLHQGRTTAYYDLELEHFTLTRAEWEASQ